MSGYSAILLAAGESRRMGSVNKLTLPVAGQPLLRRTAETLLKAGLHELVVVVGHEQQTARGLLRGLPLRIVSNDNYTEGQMTSVHCGMAALQQVCDAVLVCLSDQPLLETEDLRQLTDAFALCPTSVLVPTYQGQRGNPIVMAYEHRQKILAGDRNLGCKRLIQKHPELVSAVEMDNDHTVFDLDTPEAYRQLQVRLGEAADPSDKLISA
ncbi:MAG: nucleotidyltransferase family protein [Gammaproteobacteria bacterium]|nr:nucleotidyltransferase family protein [Gammaproteobacteria bacterium]